MILAIDTATHWQSVAILEESRVLVCHGQDAMGSHTRCLIPTIDRVLASCQIQVSGLSGLALSVGPGSFSGLRVGLSTLSGFRLGLGLPLVGVPTLEAMAWNVCDADLPLCPTVKGRTGEMYWALFRWSHGTLTRLQEDRVGTLEEMAYTNSEPTMVFGEGWLANQQRLKELLEGRLCEAAEDVMMTSAKSVGLASIERFKAGNLIEDGFVPHYVQPSYAELNWKGKK